jgi:hydroxyacylglutathione hydrolase
MALKAAILPVTPFQQNCSLVWNDETMVGAVIDPGGEIDRLLKAVAEIGFTIEKIFITHGHADHAGGAAELKGRTGVPIEGPHPDDAFWIDTIETQAAQFGLVGAHSFTPDRWLADGDTVTFDTITFDVRHCPGHTPGHVVFHHPPSKLCFVGDVLFQGSIGRTDFPRGNHQDLLNSIRERLWPMGDDTTFVPGHGPISTFGQERRTNPFVADSVA